MPENILNAEEQRLLDEVLNELDGIEETTISSNNDAISENSPTFLNNNHTSRFSSAIWYDNIKTKTITVGGIGGIGSHLVFLLSRLQPQQLIIYDFDTVDSTNISGQLYRIEDMGLAKTAAISDIIKGFSEYNTVIARNINTITDTDLSKIVMCGFDNMIARKLYFNQWFKKLHHLSDREKRNYLFIDGRLNAEEFQIFCIRGDDYHNIIRYKDNYLFSDSEAEETTCSYKQTTFCASMIASYMTNLLVNFCANEVKGPNKPIIDRDLPFLTRYNVETMFLKTES